MMRYLAICSLFILLFSCEHEHKKGIYNQGRIEYQITYLNAQKDHYDPAFLPRKMTLSFNQDYSIDMINGFMGFFKLGNITYFKKKKVRTHLKVLDKNYEFNGGKNEMICCFSGMQHMKIRKDTVVKNIAGLKSKQLHISFADNTDSFNVYYTDEINLADPNANNPYHDITGVLTQFRLKMGPYLMLFTATNFDSTAAPDGEMEVPDDAVQVNRDEMLAILDRLMQQNN